MSDANMNTTERFEVLRAGMTPWVDADMIAQLARSFASMPVFGADFDLGWSGPSGTIIGEVVDARAVAASLFIRVAWTARPTSGHVVVSYAALQPEIIAVYITDRPTVNLELGRIT